MATKVTATQRKHAIQSLLSTYTAKMDAIRQEFTAKPENRLRVVPMQVMPNVGEALRAVMGMESPAVLKTTREELIRSVEMQRGSFYNFNPVHFVHPLNHSVIQDAQDYNEVITQRNREEVDGKLALLKNAYTRACDVTVLTESGDEILRVLHDFEQREF